MPGPRRYEVDAPRSSELVAWLTCNDVNPRDVPYPSQVFLELAEGADWVIRYSAYARQESGAIKYNLATQTFECIGRSAPLVTDPPMWWLKGTAPSEVRGTEGAEVLPDWASSSEDNLPDGACNCD